MLRVPDFAVSAYTFLSVWLLINARFLPFPCVLPKSVEAGTIEGVISSIIMLCIVGEAINQAAICMHPLSFNSLAPHSKNLVHRHGLCWFVLVFRCVKSICEHMLNNGFG